MSEPSLQRKSTHSLLDYNYRIIATIFSTVCDDMKLEWVHISLIIIGAIVYINGMCFAVGLGVTVCKKAHGNIGRCTVLYIITSK